MNRLIDKAWEAPCDSAVEQVILVFLADKMGVDGKCFPSVTTICKACKISRSTAFENLQKLKSKGLIDWIPGNYERGSSRYSINLEDKARKNGSPPAGPPRPPKLPPVIRHPDGGSPPAGPEPSLNPYLEPRGKPPKFVNEYDAQIKTAERLMQKLETEWKDCNGYWTDKEKRSQFRSLKAKVEKWTGEMLALG